MYRAGVMSKVDPKGYYACLGVEPWATADQIRAAFHRCARALPSRPQPEPLGEGPLSGSSTKLTGRLAIQANGAPTTGRGGLAQRASMGPTLAPFAGGGPSLRPVRVAPGSKRLALLMGGGALGLGLLGLLFQVAVGPSGPEPLSGTSSPVIAQSSAFLAQIDVRADPSAPAGASRAASKSGFQHRVGFPRPAPTENKILAGAWLLRDLRTQTPP